MISQLMNRVSLASGGDVVGLYVVQVIAWKALLFKVFSVVDRPELSAADAVTLGCMTVGCAAMHFRSRRMAGLLLVAMAVGANVIAGFPYTINHAVFDSLVLVGYLAELWGRNDDGIPTDPSRLAKFGILSVFLYAGLQKIAHGYYVDGQFLILKFVYSDDEMGACLRWVFGVACHLVGLDMPALPVPMPAWLMAGGVQVPRWMLCSLIAMSNVVVGMEVLCPIFVWMDWGRRRAIVSLLMLEVFIAVVSQEFSFAFTTVACLLAFFPAVARLSYPIAFLVLAVTSSAWQVFR